jgi:L-ribulokinase
MADVLGRSVEIPVIENATSVGAAIHGAVAAGIVSDYAEGTRRFGAKDSVSCAPRTEHKTAYDALYRNYKRLCEDASVRYTMHRLNAG